MAEKLNNTVIPTTKFTYGKPRKVESFTTQSETFWRGKMGAETTITHERFPLLKMLYVPGEGIYCQWQDGSDYLVPTGNIKGMEFQEE